MHICTNIFFLQCQLLLIHDDMLKNIFSQSVLFQDLNGEILPPVNLKDYLRNITFIMDHVRGDFIIYIDPLFKPIVLYQDMDTKQENLSHTADTTGECSQLLSNSLATGNSMVSVFVLFFYRATCFILDK